MAITTAQSRAVLQPNVRQVLDRLRMAVRCYVALEGAAQALAWLGAAFWFSLAVDWFFEPPVAVRAAVLSLAAAGFAWVLIRQVLLRVGRRISDASMAAVLERRFRQLDDTLLTAVILGSRSLEPDKCDPRMLARTCREAAQRIEGVRLAEVFDFAPLRRSLLAAVLLGASVALFGAMFSEQWGVWVRRNLLLADELYPRRTYLEVLGFDPPDRVRKVARGADLELRVRAYTRHPVSGKPLVIPQRVEVRYRTESGQRGRKPMIREGHADPARDSWQEYSLKFESILSSLDFEVRGGDARVRNLRILVVDSPTITQMTLECRYPDYMGRAPRRLPVSGVMQVPLGTDVTVLARSSKELTRVQVDSRGDELSEPVILTADQLDADRRGFRFRFGPLRADCTLLFTPSDTDGITLREPVPLGLVAVPDEPPQTAVRLDGIGTAITPRARLPFAGRISDDYGLGRIWAETTIDERASVEHLLAQPSDRPVEWAMDSTALEVDPLKLTPGQKLQVCVKAADLCDLAEGPNVGTSERWLLDVVTAEQLRAMLESRELVLRQRFEVIIAEMTETRQLLARLDFAPDEENPAAEGTGTGSASETSAPGGGSSGPEAGSAAGSGAESDSAGSAEPAESPERRLAMRLLQIERALQNCRKNAYETQGVAESFDEIYKQLVNNRIDTEELKRRIGEQIAGPLHQVADQMFAELDRRLEALRDSAADPRQGTLDRQRAVEQADRILAEMRRVLDRMIELEDFNQAVELLRTIIELQDELDDQTRERLKQKLRELLED